MMHFFQSELYSLMLCLNIRRKKKLFAAEKTHPQHFHEMTWQKSDIKEKERRESERMK